MLNERESGREPEKGGEATGYVFRFLSSKLSLLTNIRNFNVLFMGLPQSLCQQSTFRVFECSERRDSSNLSVTGSKDIGIND